MPDLHGWITQQIDTTEAVASAATPGPWHVTEYDWQTDFDAGIGTSPGGVDVVGHGYEGGGVECTEDARHIALNDPATVLRRCAADRKILAEHKPREGGWYDWYACEGCGYDGADYCSEPMTSHINDCPTLLALAEGYGLTEEQRAALDRPEVERPAPGPSLLPNGLAEAMYGKLWAHVIGTRPVVPHPEVKAMEILAPELKKIPGYTPATEAAPDAESERPLIPEVPPARFTTGSVSDWLAEVEAEVDRKSQEP